MAQSGNGAACESDATSLGTGQELNFDDDTLKGKDILQLLIVCHPILRRKVELYLFLSTHRV